MRLLGIRRRGERGQALVEIALLTPILVTLLVGIIELGDAFNAHMGVVNASRDGARLIARGGASDSQAVALVMTDLGRLRDSTSASDISIAHLTVSGEDAVKVTTCHNRTLIVNYPLLPLPNPMKLCSTTTMRVLKTTS